MPRDFERATAEEVAAWANSLGLCEFEVYRDDIHGDAVRAKGCNRVSLSLCFGTYANSVPGHGGERHLAVWANDTRNGYVGSVMGGTTWGEVERYVRNAAKRLGLDRGQLRLF